jgi:hypothetical protein
MSGVYTLLFGVIAYTQAGSSEESRRTNQLDNNCPRQSDNLFFMATCTFLEHIFISICDRRFREGI